MAVLLGASPPVMASTIQYALVSKSDGQVTVEVRLTCSHRYESHEPATAAREVVVSLTRIGACPGSGDSDHDTARPAGREMASLEQVDYDARGPTAAVVQLHFRDPALVTIRQGADLRSLRIAVTVEPGATAAPEAAPREPVSAAPALTPEQQARIEAKLRGLAAPAAQAAALGDFVINLASSTGPPDLAGVPADLAAGRQVYAVSTDLEGETWQQLRLGFYATEQDAEAALQQLRARYPNAWVTRVGATERARAQTFGGVAAAQPGAVESARPPQAGVATLGAEQLATIMTEARSAFLAGDFDRAIVLYTRVLSEPRNAYSQEAQEFLGVARDRKGQVAQAIEEYRRYLADYPEGDSAARVSQRLVALTTARETPKGSLRAANQPGAWDSSGSFSQYYRRDEGDFSDKGMVTKSSLVQTDGDFSARRHGDRVDFASRATVGYDYDLLKDPGMGGNRTRIYDLYADVFDRDWGLGVRLGRQTERSGGVLGRYDGARVSYLVRPDIKLNVMGGYPVYLSSDGLETDRVFYGVSVDLNHLLERVDTSFYYNTQDIDGINDREAVGAEFRYFDESRSVVGLIDYDVGFNTVNTLSIFGNWAFESGTTVSASADYRRVPYTLTENALIGQSADSLDELRQLLSEDQIRDLAVDRSGEMLTYSLGVSRPLAERWQVNADFSVIQIAEGEGSGNVLALPDSGTGYYVYTSLVGSSLFTEGDVSIFGLRYSDDELTRVSSVYTEARFPLTNRLRLNPLFSVSHREIAADGSSEWLARPAMRLLYRFAQRYEVDLEAGGELGSRTGGDTDGGVMSDARSWYVYMGYRADF